MISWYKKALFVVLPFVGTLCVASIVSAEHSDWQGGRDEEGMSRRDLYSFERYLNTHWETAQQLYQDPDLLKDRRYIRSHDSLQDWLDSHADAAQALRDNPHKYVWRQQAYQREANPEVLSRMSERDLQSF